MLQINGPEWVAWNQAGDTKKDFRVLALQQRNIRSRWNPTEE